MGPLESAVPHASQIQKNRDAFTYISARTDNILLFLHMTLTRSPPVTIANTGLMFEKTNKQTNKQTNKKNMFSDCTCRPRLFGCGQSAEAHYITGRSK